LAAAVSSPTQYTIRPALPVDLEAINNIYNIQVDTSTSVYTYHRWTLEERKAWYAGLTDNGHELIIAEVDGETVGFAYYSDFRKKEGYRFTVESTVHVHPDFHGLGVGTALMHDLIGRMSAKEYRLVIAVIAADNEGSLHLHHKLGFETAGHFKNVGYKFDRWLDLKFLQLDLRRE
jgi:phosphinothricin acetyltransferase